MTINDSWIRQWDTDTLIDLYYRVEQILIDRDVDLTEPEQLVSEEVPAMEDTVEQEEEEEEEEDVPEYDEF